MMIRYMDPWNHACQDPPPPQRPLNKVCVGCSCGYYHDPRNDLSTLNWGSRVPNSGYIGLKRGQLEGQEFRRLGLLTLAAKVWGFGA